MKQLVKKLAMPAVKKASGLGVVNRLLTRAFMRTYQLPVEPLHYYSPLPDINRLKNSLERWYQPGDWSAIDLNLDGQLQLLEELKVYKSECDKLPSFTEISAAGYGPGYGEVEAHLLHGLLRYLRPSRIIEVGSGVSSYFIANALACNRAQHQIESTMVCVDIFPSSQLRTLISDHRGVLLAKEVQEVGTEPFAALNAGDVLFIDSSHVSKLGSDVNFLYLEVLPILKPGVWIHIHDMPFPYLAAPPEHPLFDLYLFWNEAALVKGFLMYNSAFKIRISQSYLHHQAPEALADSFSVYDRTKHFPMSLWLEKVQ